MKIFNFIFGFMLIMVIGCGSTNPSIKKNRYDEKKPCISEVNSESIIRWGGHNMKTHHLAGWQITADGKLMQFKKEGKESDYIFTDFSKVRVDKFCELLDSAQKYFLEIQALNAPGDSSHFVQYINPKTGTDIRAVWNMRYKTYGSREFRMLFDSLEAIADREYKIFLKKGDNPGNTVK